MKNIYKYIEHTRLISNLPLIYQPSVVLCKKSNHIHFEYYYDSCIEYLQNDSTAYINTLVKGCGDQRIECIFMPTRKTTGYNCIYGARNSPGSCDGIYIYSNTTSNNVGYVGYNSTTQNNLAAAFASLNVKHTLIQNKGTFTLDGTTVKTVTNATFTSTANIFIFDGSNNNSPGKYYGYFKLYSFKIYNNDNIIRDFIPVRVGTTGYLFDKVSKQLFGNSGSGSFICGPDI